MPLLAAGLFVCLATTVRAEDWPGFRGPNRDGISKETGLLKTWPEKGPPKVWTAKNLGIGFGTPSVADGKIFGLGTREGKEIVWALKEADGTELWSAPVDDPLAKIDRNNGPSSTPTYDNGKLYTVSSKGKLECFDATKGESLWTKDYRKDFGSGQPGWGFTESVLIDGDKLICAPGSAKFTVVAMNKDTGKVIWQTELASGAGGGGGYSSPLKATIAGTPMYVVLLGSSGGIIGVSQETGKVLWQYKKTPAAGGVAQIPIPVVSGDNVWVSPSYGGGSALLTITAGKAKGTFEVEEVISYAKPKLNNHHGGMVLVDGYVYFGHDQNEGRPVCVDIKTGRIKWGPEDSPAGDSKSVGSAAVLYADGRLYFRYQNTHSVFLIEPSPEGLKVVSSFKEPEPSGKQSWAHPVIANGKLLLRDQEKMHCFNVKGDKN